MKKTFLAMTLLVAFSISSFAGGTDVDMKLLNDLASTLKSSAQINWTNKDTYTKATFNFNDRIASAFYSADNNELIGFAVQFDKQDLPDFVSNVIANKYGDWQLKEAIVFIDPKGYINYYAQVQKGKKALALKVTPNGNLSVYSSFAPGN
jgi:hypothetical protein